MIRVWPLAFRFFLSLQTQIQKSKRHLTTSSVEREVCSGFGVINDLILYTHIIFLSFNQYKIKFLKYFLKTKNKLVIDQEWWKKVMGLCENNCHYSLLINSL